MGFSLCLEWIDGKLTHPSRSREHYTITLSVHKITCDPIAKHLVRVVDHAMNITEGVILVAQALDVKHAEKLRG